MGTAAQPLFDMSKAKPIDPPGKTLAQMIRAKYPTAYTDMSDTALEQAVLAKHPEYSDLPRTTDPAKPLFDMSKAAPLSVVSSQPLPELKVVKSIALPTERAMQQTMGGPPMFVDVPQGQKQVFEEAGQKGYQAGAAIGAGAVTTGALGGAALAPLFAPTVGTATVGTGLLDASGAELTKDIATQGPSLARAGINMALNAIKSHPIISSYVATHIANALGIPLPKVLKAMAGIREVAE